MKGESYLTLAALCLSLVVGSRLIYINSRHIHDHIIDARLNFEEQNASYVSKGFSLFGTVFPSFCTFIFNIH